MWPARCRPPRVKQAQKFITENPVMFGDRRILSLDQIQFLQPPNIGQMPLKDAKTMAEVERCCWPTNIEFAGHRSRSTRC
jgi:hypothetical protein